VEFGHPGKALTVSAAAACLYVTFEYSHSIGWSEPFGRRKVEGFGNDLGVSVTDMADNETVFAAPGAKSDLEEGLVFTPRFGSDGLIPAIVTEADSNEILMFAHMNAEALRLTISTATAHFYSRSRDKLWKKGEESGNLLRVEGMRTDCDQDVVWLSVRIDGHGAACHTGRKTCFYRDVALGPPKDGSYSLVETVHERAFDPGSVYDHKGGKP